MDQTTDLTGRIVGKYKIVQRLGRGGMAEVYQAYQASLDRHVAIKVILPFMTADPDFLKRFEREARAVAALRHPNIIQVFDYDVEAGMPYMVMEYLEGDSLKSLLEKLERRGQTLPDTQAVRLVREIAQALGFAHRQNVVHRDVKPSNVMMDRSGRVVLTDFGVAKIVGGTALTASGAATGTPAYMSPEQALGRAVDQRADLYALGVILYEMVTGQVPFDADTPLAVMLKHAHEARPSPRRLRADLSDGLERIILKCLAREPDERFQSADELIGHLNNPAAAAQLAIPASATTPADPATVGLSAVPAERPADEAASVAAARPPTSVAPSANPAAQDVARTLNQPLKEIACYNCTGAGLELEPDGRVRCAFCGEVNLTAGPVCPRCETVNATGAEFCVSCNLALVRTCPNCDTRNWSGAERCAHCGRPLDTLSALMDRVGDAGERFHKDRRDLAAVSAREAAGAEQRLAQLAEIDQRRRDAIQRAAARKAREQQIALIATAVVAGLIVLAVAVIVIVQLAS
jgi:serine/threonine-protein kinase